MSLEQKIEELTNKVELLSIAISTLTAAIVVTNEKGGATVAAPAQGEEQPRRRRKAVDPAKAETEALPRFGEAGAAVAEAAAAVPTVPQAPAVEPPKEEVKTIGEHLAAAGVAAHTDPAAAVPTKEELIAKFQQLVAKLGKDPATAVARRIITDLGAANVSGIPEDKRAAAVAAVDAELAKA